jgi:hypothetical protein
MSTLLDQAIIDAAALKEVAIKMPKLQLLKSTPSEIKEAVKCSIGAGRRPRCLFR